MNNAYKKIILLSIIILIIFTLYSYTSAYDEVETHPLITEAAASKKPYLKDYLIDNLGISDGLETVINEKMIIEWLMEGSTNEDLPWCRASNHFFDPTVEPWEQAYLTDTNPLIDYWCSNGLYPPVEIDSNIFWATGYYDRPNNPNVQPVFTDNEWNWPSAMLYYRIALEPGTEAVRNNNLVKTFESLGHLVHLLQDVSVPAHVRNDLTAHLSFQGLEISEPLRSFGNGFEHYVKQFSEIVKNVQTTPLDFTNWVVTDFWDTDGSTATGLAEIINPNYFSASTMPSNSPPPEHQYNYPFIDNVDYQICEEVIPYPSNPPTKMKYISRKAKGVCPPPEQMAVDNFANVSLLNEESEINDQNISSLKLWLDDNVYDTYAREILPLAVSYSEGLINYFFRGEIEATISGNELTIKNVCDFTIGDGVTELNLYWDDNQGNRNSGLSLLLKDGNGFDAAFGPLLKNEDAVFTFTPQTNVNKYIIEYHGPIGNEYGVLGKVLSAVKSKLPDTGQNQSYTSTFGEDSDYTINPLSYTDNSDGTVTDNNTRLMWQQDDDNNTYTWDNAKSYCGDLSLAGHTGWRLPTLKELAYILDYGTYSLAIDETYFPSTNPSFYWSSTITSGNTSGAWGVYFYDGDSNYGYKSSNLYVRCIRGTESTQSFTDNGNGTVTDNTTGLMWQQDADTKLNWESAITYCEDLSLAGYNSWRLPNIKELRSIVDYNEYNPAIDETYFPNTNSSYWSSTTDATNTGYVWSVQFSDGNSYGFSKFYLYSIYVRCIRGGD